MSKKTITLDILADKLDHLDSTVSNLDSRLVQLDSKVDKLEPRFDQLESRFDSKLLVLEDNLTAKFDSKLNALEHRLESKMDDGFAMVKQGFDDVEVRFTGIDEQLNDMKLRLDNAAYHFEVVQLDQRVTRLERTAQA